MPSYRSIVPDPRKEIRTPTDKPGMKKNANKFILFSVAIGGIFTAGALLSGNLDQISTRPTVRQSTRNFCA
jgi:hypothetical protein